MPIFGARLWVDAHPPTNNTKTTANNARNSSSPLSVNPLLVHNPREQRLRLRERVSAREMPRALDRFVGRRTGALRLPRARCACAPPPLTEVAPCLCPKKQAWRGRGPSTSWSSAGTLRQMACATRAAPSRLPRADPRVRSVRQTLLRAPYVDDGQFGRKPRWYAASLRWKRLVMLILQTAITVRL